MNIDQMFSLLTSILLSSVYWGPFHKQRRISFSFRVGIIETSTLNISPFIMEKFDVTKVFYVIPSRYYKIFIL